MNEIYFYSIISLFYIETLTLQLKNVIIKDVNLLWFITFETSIIGLILISMSKLMFFLFSITIPKINYITSN